MQWFFMKSIFIPIVQGTLDYCNRVPTMLFMSNGKKLFTVTSNFYVKITAIN